MTIYRLADLSPDSDDRQFVISTWASSYKSAHAAGLILSEDWAAIMHDQIGKLLDRQNTRTIVACDPPSMLYGFICGNTSGPVPIVHYVYVKAGYRTVQVVDGRTTDGRFTAPRFSGPRHARGLFRALGVDPAGAFLFSCKTAIVSQLTPKIPRGRFVPAAGRYENYNHRQERDHE